MVLQPDGKIVAAGQLNGDLLAIARFHPNGALDASFGAGGMVRTSYGPGAFGDIEGLALQADGKIVGAGRILFTGAGPSDFAVIRLNPNGSRDASFGTNGVVLSNYPGSDEADDVLIQPNGQVVIVGALRPDTGPPANSMIARLNADGSRDTTFGTEPSLGRTVLDLRPSKNDDFRAVHFHDGKIVVGGRHGGGGDTDQSFSLARFDPGVPVSVTASAAAVVEGGDAPLLYTFLRAGNDVANAVTIHFSVGGTATFSADYSVASAAGFTFNSTAGNDHHPGRRFHCGAGDHHAQRLA